MAAKEVVCDFIQSQGIEYLFGNPGTTEVPFLDALAGFPSIRYVLALHESAAMAMADGYARISGRPGLVNVHTTPGVSNSLGMMFNARREGVPIVVLAGQQFAYSLLREPALASDLVQLTEQFTKWSYQVNRADELPLALARAFKTAMQPPQGPVFLSLPRDILDEEVEVGEWPGRPTNPPYRPRGDRGDIERAAELLSKAQSPAVLVGSGIHAFGAAEELTALAETCALRVYATPGILPWDHPLLCGEWRPLRQGLQAPLQGTDLLLVVGSPMFREFPPMSSTLGMPVIHVDADPWEVGKNYPTCLGIVSDPKTGLEDIRQSVEKRIGKKVQRDAIRRRGQAIEAINRESRASRAEDLNARWESTCISASRLVGELARVLEPNALIVDESLRSGTYLREFYPFRSSGSYMTSDAGCLGWGLGAALGAKLAQPQRQVVAFLGDGSTCFQLQALWTAARHMIAVPTIVCRNGAYMAVKSSLSLYGGECNEQGNYDCAELAGIDFVGLATSFGIEARRVERTQDLKSALEWSISQERPTLLEVAVDPQDAGHGVPRVS